MVEVHRAALQQIDQSLEEQVQGVMAGVSMIELDLAINSAAGALEPSSLRSLDAIHIASALSMNDELDGFLTFDARQADAARQAGLPVIGST